MQSVNRAIKNIHFDVDNMSYYCWDLPKMLPLVVNQLVVRETVHFTLLCGV